MSECDELKSGDEWFTDKMRLGMLPSRAMTWSRETASSLPTMSTTLLGRYFSTHGTS